MEENMFKNCVFPAKKVNIECPHASKRLLIAYLFHGLIVVHYQYPGEKFHLNELSGLK